MVQRGPDEVFFSRQVRDARRFFINLAGRPTSDLQVVSGGWELLSPDYHIDRRDFPWYAVEIVMAGRLAVDLGTGRQRLGPGDVFVYGPDQAHQLQAEGEENLLKYFLDFRGSRPRATLERLGLLPGRLGSLAAPDEARRLMDELIHHGQGRRAGTTQVGDRLLQALLALVSETLGPLRSQGEGIDTYRKLRLLLEREALGLTSVGRAADQLGISGAYASRLFQRFAGESPHQFLIRRRMEYAADQLLSEGRKVKDVADALGFADPYQFSKSFKKTMGVSPSALRAKKT